MEQMTLDTILKISAAITGAIIGVGSVKRLSAVRWGVTRQLLVAWILTIPVSALIAAIVYWALGHHLIS